jgi:uncharacterized protein (DUF1800 family)
MPLPEISGPLGKRNAAHLLRRATFGATNEELETFAALTPAQAINALFHQTLPDPQPPIDPKTGLEWVYSGVTDANSEGFELERYYLAWHLGQMMSAGVPANLSLAYGAREKIVFFLHTHFTTIKSKVFNIPALFFQNLLLRQFALDSDKDETFNIKTLTVKISVDNAMLRLLDGNLNVKGRVNENYARELLELYTIGRGLPGKVPEGLAPGDYYVFTEHDVRMAARVLSGWNANTDLTTIDDDTGLPRGRVRGSELNASAHDNEVKTFSERFNSQSVTPDPLLLNGANPTELSALDEIRQLIEIIYSSDETARNICWKIYRFFVYAPHDRWSAGNSVAFIDEHIISPMAETLRTNGFKIQPVIENLLRSEHFYHSGNAEVIDDNFGCIIKSPLDLAIGTLRSFGVTVPDMATDVDGFYRITQFLLRVADDLGMSFYEPYDVAGYEAYHQFPIYNRIWITPNSLAKRYDFIRKLFQNDSQSAVSIDVLDYVVTNFPGEAADARQLIIALAQTLLPMAENLTFDEGSDDYSALTARRLNYFKERFLQEFDEAYWTNRWNNGAGDLRDQLAFLFNAMLQSPEYQLA